MMKILVTGATGFIGSNLVKSLLSQGHEVAITQLAGTDLGPLRVYEDRLGVFVYDGALSGLCNAVKQSEPELVYHIASLFLVRHEPEDVDRLVDSNILFPTQLLEVMHGAGVRKFVNVGTTWQHYQDAPFDPVNLYAASKQAFESILSYYVNACNIRAITLKMFDTFGPGDNRPKLMRLLRNAARSGEALKMSPGEQKIDLVYIDDVVRALVIAGQRVGEVDGQESHGVCTGNPLTLRDFVAIYSEAVGREVAVLWGSLPYRPREVMVPWKNYTLLPGWRAEVALRDGIRRMESDAEIGGLLASQPQ